MPHNQRAFQVESAAESIPPFYGKGEKVV